MNERIVPGRLTQESTSSTLNRVRSESGNIPMPEPPKEGRQPDSRTNNGTSPEGARQQFDRVMTDARQILANNPELRDAMQQDPLGVLKYLAEQGGDDTEGILSGIGIKEDPRDRRTREQILKSQGPDRGDRFQLHDEPEEPPGGAERTSNENNLGHINIPLGTDRELASIAALINKQIGTTIKPGSEDSLETLRELRNRFNERLVKLPNSASAYPLLEELNGIEERLVASVVEAGRGSERDKAQHRLWVASTRYEAEEKKLEEARRRGETIDPERLRRHTEERSRLIREIIEEIEAEETPSLEAGRFPPSLMNAALKFKETRELLINEIIFKPYEDKTEQGHYEINFYASGTLDELLAAMGKMAKRSREDRKIYEDYKGIKTTARNFWEMNRGLWTGNLETFSRIAEEMNFEQFDLMKDLPGVGVVMRLYEKKLFEELGRRGRITADGFDNVKKEVERVFKAMNEGGFIKSAYYDERYGDEATRKKFEEWEINRALSVGRVYYNISFRSAEVIALGLIDVGEGGKAYTSFPLENAARIMDGGRLTAKRFGMGEKKGGQVLWDGAGRNWRDYLKETRRHLGINRFTRINGVSVDDLEFAASTGISGVFSGWRMFYAMYPAYKFKLKENGVGEEKEISLREILRNSKLPFELPDKEEITLSEIMGGEDEISDTITMIYKNRKNGKETRVRGLAGYIGAIKDDEGLNLKEKQNEIVKALDFLVGDSGILKTGLGAFLRIAQGNQGAHGMLSGEVGFKARQQIWERIAETNPLAIINILTGLSEGEKDKYDNLLESNKSLRNILMTQGWISAEHAKIKDPNNQNFYLSNVRWVALRDKLELNHEIEVMKQIDPEFNVKPIKYEPDEEILLEVIKNTFIGDNLDSRSMTEDMADIIFPYMTFINDVPFENFTYSKVGNQFFKRRFGDIGQYNSAVSKGIFAMLDNIGGMKPEDVIGAFSELNKGIAGPNGEPSGWDAVLPWELSFLDMAETYEGPNTWAPIKDLKKLTRQATSKLQEYAGPKALSLSKKEADELLVTMRQHGVVGKETQALIKKKKRLTLGEIIWAVILDMLPLFVLDAGLGVFKAPVSASAK